MTDCAFYPQCGGCTLRKQSKEAYQEEKYASFLHIMKHIKQEKITYGTPVFIPEKTRRRASLTFSFIKKKLFLGFNISQSHAIINISECLLLTPKLNNTLPIIRKLIEAICEEPYTIKKGKKIIRQNITQGDVVICEADNGIDMILEIPCQPELSHRMIISEIINSCSDIIRVSWRQKAGQFTETILEKTQPFITNSGVQVFIPAGTFLQASREGEQALIELVKKYIGERYGKIADLFCGVGTFSYPLAQNKKNQILAIDSSIELLQGFQQSVNHNQIPNIKIETKNLFKYPLDERELSGVDIVIFDPPRAGAATQVAKISTCSQAPKVVVAVSCNPRTFVNDANALISGGYTLKEITMVDQFTYSSHTELVALFEKERR